MTPIPSSPVFNVRAFGAKGDGTTLDTEAINRAIDAASTAGGGTVWFPAGTYASHSIRLKSHIALHLDAGCTILAAEPPAPSGPLARSETTPPTGRGDEHTLGAAAAPGAATAAFSGPGYDAPEPNEWGDVHRYQDFGHSHWHNSLIWGDGLENIAITGPGRIYGKGLSRGVARPGGANKAIALKLCRNVVLRDFSMLQGGHFALLATGVDNLTIDNVKVDTNRDGFDIDACRHVRITGCSVNTPNDDAIVLKSSFALGVARACENITITGCQVTGYNAGSFLDGTYLRTQERAPDQEGPTGRIKIGTESNGGFKSITISNCVFDRSRGLALETVDGGPIEDIAISNITMRDVSNSPLFIRLGNRARGPVGTPVAVVRRITISNVVVSDADARFASIISGLPDHPIEDLALSNIRIAYRGGLTLDHAAKQPLELINRFFLRNAPELMAPRDPFAVPELEKTYPEPCTFGILPAYGFYIRHVKGLTVRDVQVSFAKEDTRHAVVLQNVADAHFRGLEAQLGAGASTFILRNVRDFSVADSAPLPDTRRDAAENESL